MLVLSQVSKSEAVKSAAVVRRPTQAKRRLEWATRQLINIAVAEKVSALRTEDYFRERGRRADRAETLRILERAGKGNPPMKGDELPAEWRTKPGRKAANERDR